MGRLWSLVFAAGICLLCVQAAQAGNFNRACTSVPRHLWLSLQALETKVEAQGFKVAEEQADEHLRCFRSAEQQWRTS
jgi:hypothetical protein